MNFSKLGASALAIFGLFHSRLAVDTASAQSVRPTRTSAPVLESALEAQFSDIAFVRELPNRTVLLYDREERQLLAANFQASSVMRVGALGAGPSAYGSIGALVPLAGDSTLIVDVSNRRWAIIVGQDIRTLVPPDHPSLRWGLSAFGAAFGPRLLVGNRVQKQPGGSQLELRLVDRSSGNGTVVTTLALVPIRREVTSRNADGTPAVFRAMPELLAAPEQAIQFSDGWIAVVRLRPYRVSWLRPDGAWVNGESLIAQSSPVTEEEKQAFASRISRSTGRRWDPASTSVWASEVAPIAEADALVALPDGTLLVRRSLTAKSPHPLHDIVDRTGRLVGQFSLPPTHRIVGAGNRAIYIVVEDEDGLQRLQRHSVPR